MPNKAVLSKSKSLIKKRAHTDLAMMFFFKLKLKHVKKNKVHYDNFFMMMFG